MSKHRHTHALINTFYTFKAYHKKKQDRKKTLNKKGMQKSYGETEQKDKQVELHRS